jgi:hypothetical protein
MNKKQSIDWNLGILILQVKLNSFPQAAYGIFHIFSLTGNIQLRRPSNLQPPILPHNN